MIKARVRDGASWNDALILNMSSRGLLIRSDKSPGRGSYLELRRGPHLIVARVIWSTSDRFGVQTQRPVPTAALASDPDRPVAGIAPSGEIGDRRPTSRTLPQTHERSRQGGRAVEFAAMAFACSLAAILIAGLIGDVVAAPIRAVEARLAAQ